jgi:hypothetical protein
MTGRTVLWLLLMGGTASAQSTSTCTFNLAISHTAPETVTAGDAVRVVLTFGTGTIEGGTTLSLAGLAFAVQCAPRGSKMLPCVAGGPTGARYLGDATITTTCSGVTWASTQRGNKLLLIPSTPIVIPSSTANFCDVEFDLGVTGARALLVEMVEAGFNAPEVGCNNGVRTAVLTEGAVAVQ